MSNGKVIIIHLIVGLIKTIWCDSNVLQCIKMSNFYPEPYEPFGGDINVTVDLSNYSTETHCMKIRIFVLQKFVKRTEKIIMFPFHENIIFSEHSFKRKCKKAASFRKCVFLRKYEIFVYDSCA